MDPNTGTDAEPTASSRPLPAILIGILALVVFWGDSYVMDHGGDLMGKGGSFPKEVYYPVPSYAALEKLNPEDPSKKLIEIGRNGYSYYGCIGCHQPNGMGTPGVNPPLTGSEWVNAEGPNRIARIILHGLIGPITVNGQSFNSQMPPLGTAITDDEELAGIITFIRQEWGNTGSPVTAEQVAKIREETKDRTSQWKADELLAIPAAD